MADHNLYHDLLDIQKDTLINQGEMLGELKLISDNVLDIKQDERKNQTTKYLIRLIVFQSLVIAALAGVEVGRLAQWW